MYRPDAGGQSDVYGYWRQLYRLKKKLLSKNIISLAIFLYKGFQFLQRL